MVKDLKGADKSTWIGAAYTLSSTAFQPLCGALADIFGRRPCMLGSLCFFALGSAVCGAAKDMPMLIAGRSESLLIVNYNVSSSWVIGNSGRILMTFSIKAC
jgi:MFS family permease